MDLPRSTADNAFRAVAEAWLDADRPADLKAKLQNDRCMGMADELPVGPCFKQLAMIEATPGDTDHDLAAFAALAQAA